MRKLLVLLSLAALFFAGCGGDDDGGSATDTKADSASSSEEAAEDTDFSGKGSGDFCDLARKYEEDFSDTNSGTTQADIKKEYQELTDAIDKLVDEAPSEIKADAEKVNAKFKEVNDLLAKYDYDFSKIPEDEAEKVSLDDPEIEAASDRIESYFEKVCKIDSDGDGDTDGEISDDSSTSGDEQAPDDTTDDGSETTETTEG